MGRSKLLGLLSEMEALHKISGQPASILQFAKAMAYFGLAEVKEGLRHSEAFELTKPSSSEHTCRGCMNEFLLPNLLWYCPTEHAIRKVEEFNQERFYYEGRCSDKTEIDYPLMRPLLIAGRMNDADIVYRACRDRILHGHPKVREAAALLRYFAATKESRVSKSSFQQGISLIESTFMKENVRVYSREVLDFYCGVMKFCSSFLKKSGSHQISVSINFEKGSVPEPVTIGVFAEFAKKQVLKIARTLDQRNGNEYFMNLVASEAQKAS